MTLLLSCESVEKAHGAHTLFKDISFSVFRGDKIGLIGPNGSGKSTLMRILAGKEKADNGAVTKRKETSICYVPQVGEYPETPIIDLIKNELINDIALSESDREVKAAIILGKMGFDDQEAMPSQLSGGWKKRLDIARELVKEPHLLLLDEPTNHLDVETIEWLENFLQREQTSYVIISHDRAFLNKAVNQVMELNYQFPQGVFITKGSYSEHLNKRELFLQSQLQYQQSLKSKVREEIAWLRASPQARTTKQQARIQNAEKLIDELQAVNQRSVQRVADIDFVSSERQTRKLVACKNIAKTLGNKRLFAKIDLTLTPGSRLGIVGRNGTGKSTFLKIIAEELEPDTGTVKRADGLKIVYFDQHRMKLSPKLSLKEALSDGSETVIYRGKNIHVNSWAKRFLFDPHRIDLPLSELSGGERARVLIAKLMLQPADILLLDEPTNDLDIPTLEVLEQSLSDFPGAIVLITHDRALLGNVTNELLALGTELEHPFFADYSQWQQADEEQKKKQNMLAKASITASVKEKEVIKKPSTKKLSYAETRELEQMEAKIDTAEQQKERCQAIVNELAEKKADSAKFIQACNELHAAEETINKLYERWQELESKGLS